MIGTAATMKVMMDMFAGAGPARDEMNEDLRFHALSQVAEVRPGLLARIGAGLAGLLVRRPALPGTYAGNAHLLQDLGFAEDLTFAATLTPPFVTAPFLPATSAVPAALHADLGLDPLLLDTAPTPEPAPAAPEALPRRSPGPLAAPALQF